MEIIYLAAALPAVVMGLYIWKRDHGRNPLSLLMKNVLWGVVICMFVNGLEMVAGTL